MPKRRAKIFLATVLGGVQTVALSQAPVADNATASATDPEQAIDAVMLDVVTVRSLSKRDRSLFETPASVTVIDRETIAADRITNLSDIARAVPNVSISKLGQVGGSFISIRGVASNPFIVNRTAVYVDDVPFREISDQLLSSIDSIEVLRGPQGTLYGANAEAGVVVIRTRIPEDVVEAEVDWALEDFRGGQRWQTSGLLAGPLPGTPVSGLLSVRTDRGPAYTRNLAAIDGREGRADELSALGLLRYEGPAGLQVQTSFSLQQQRAPGLYEQEYLPIDLGLYNQLYGGFNGRQLLRYQLANDAPKFYEEDASIVALRVGREIGNGEWVYAGSHRRKQTDAFGIDFDLSGLPTGAGGQADDERFDSHELRWLGEHNGMSWTLGTAYLDQRLQRALTVGTATGTQYVFAPNAPQRRSARDVAVFGELRMPLAPRWHASVGGRVERAARSTLQPDSVLNLPGLGEFIVAGADDSRTFNAFLPRLSAEFAASDRQMYYVTAARGWLPGGFNLEAVRSDVLQDFRRFESERLQSIELGGRWRVPDHGLSLSAAVFAMEASNWQEFNTAVDETGAAVSTNLITSDARLKSRGAELELAWQVSESLSLTGFAGFVDANYGRYVFSPTQDFSGNRAAFVARWNAAVTADYELASGWFARATLGGVGPTPLDAGNQSLQSAYERVDLQLGYRGINWSFRLFSENLTNALYFSGGAYDNFVFGSDGVRYAPVGPPRRIGAELTWRF